MHIQDGFQQTPYSLPPAWDSELAFKALLRRQLPPATYAALDSELKAFQVRLAGPLRKLGALADMTEPSVTQFDQWGRRVDILHTSEGWRKIKDEFAAEGMVSTFMERKQGEHSRTFGFAKLFLWAPDSRMVGCPYSMTDGCARVLELAGTPQMKRDVLPKLMTRDPKEAWTSGQWMTERPGGSDVSLTETVARPTTSSGKPQPGDKFILDGFKWFSSATDGNVSLALARTSEAKGSRGLSLFLVKLRDEQGGPNGINIHRLKKKYGTKAIPTAELSLNGTIGELIGEPGQGIPIISTVLNITRLHSASHSAAGLARSLSIAKAFAKVRHVGGERGTLLIENAMHTSTLLQSELVSRALTQFAFGLITLMGKDEAHGEGRMSESEKWRLRLLTPVVKAFNSHMAIREMPCVMEALGGQGYMEENEISRLIADCSVEKIWEGTTNVLALDVVRVILKSKGVAIEQFIKLAALVLAAPTSTPVSDAPFSTSTATMEEAISCPHGLTGNRILFLIHGTGSTGNGTWENTPYNLLLSKTWDVCWVDLPGLALVDVQRSAEYVASVRFNLAIVGHSQGAGINPQWALTFWPSIQPLVSNYIALAGDFHAFWQQTINSRYLGAQNSMLPGGGGRAQVPTTSIYTQYDDVIQPETGPFGPTSYLEGAGVHSLQDGDVCGPAHIADHFAMTTDAAAYGLAVAALEYGSPVDMAKFDRAAFCTQLGLIPPIVKRSLDLLPPSLGNLLAPSGAGQNSRETSNTNAQTPNYGNSTYAASEPTLQPYVCARGFAGPNDCGAAFSFTE
ncbi:hypothetical protein RQP46_010599 [Phenoliferia psychrophenolica]